MPSLSDLPAPPPGRVGWPWTEAAPALPPTRPGGQPWPRLSIVTPSFNQAPFLEETLRSVLLQGYPDLEYLVLDGGSTDGSVEIIRRYAPWLTHWASAPDRGQADAINQGFRRATGDVLAWLNSDDIYLPGALAAQVGALSQAPTVGLVYGDAAYVNPAGERLFVSYGRPYTLLDLLRFAIPVQPTTFLRRSVYEAIGELDLSFRCSLDSDYWVRAARVTAFQYTPSLIATYRLHAHSKTVSEMSSCYRDWCRILDAFFANPEHQARYGAWRRGLYADLLSQMAAAEIRQGDLRAGLAQAGRALRQGGLRSRLFKVLPALVERFLAPDLTLRAVGWWTRLRRRG